jgi:hypothetical protein
LLLSAQLDFQKWEVLIPLPPRSGTGPENTAYDFAKPKLNEFNAHELRDGQLKLSLLGQLIDRPAQNHPISQKSFPDLHKRSF